MPVPVAAVQAIQRRLRRRAGLQRRRRGAGGHARGARQGGREPARSAASADRRRVHAAARGPRSGFSRPSGRGTSRRACASCARVHRPRRAPGDRRGDGGVPVTPRLADVDQAAPPRSPGDRIALVAPASPFKREELDAGVAELTRARLRAGLRRARVRARRASSPAIPPLRARGADRRVARSGDSRRSSPCAAATAARSCCRCSIPALMREAAQGVRRLQRHHGAAVRCTCSTASCVFTGR